MAPIWGVARSLLETARGIDSQAGCGGGDLSQDQTTSNPFFDHPILNSPYEYPPGTGSSTSTGSRRRRSSRPAAGPSSSRRSRSRRSGRRPPRKRDSSSTRARASRRQEQQYDPTSIINEVRSHVDAWRALPNPKPVAGHAGDGASAPALAASQVQRRPPVLLPGRGGRDGDLADRGRARNPRAGKRLLDHLAAANRDANPELLRLALKLATGAGKTTVMAMLIAWQTINAVRRPGSKHFTRGFLVVHAGPDDQDRLRVLQPNDPDSYYASRELVPSDMLDDVNRAKIVITNYHAFKLRERIELSAGRPLAAARPRRRRAQHARDRRPDAPARHARPDGHEEHPRASTTRRITATARSRRTPTMRT